MKKNISASSSRPQAKCLVFKPAACSLQPSATRLILFFFCLLFFLIPSSYAQEITILYTGDTHAMLYPCSCPIESDGGIARRATLIKQIKASNPATLLLDSGGFFAGGLLDEYTQNTQLDMERTKINLKAMAAMKYDAVGIGDDEFNFGREFFQDNIDRSNLTFLSCNMKSDKVLPYIIKDIAGIKIGIIGATTLAAVPKAGGLKFTDPKVAVGDAVSYLRKNGVKIVVLLSHLGESEDLNLINDIPGIDILITGHTRAKDRPYTKTVNTLVLRPDWQARRLGKLSLTVEHNKIKS
jgi:5'-nucleotidase